MGNIAIIPARSGSKGLRDKNIKSLCGKPLMVYSIDAAIKSELYDVVMVSTDSEQYAEIARKYGAEVPFLRSMETASDKADSWEVVREVLRNYENMGQCFEMVTLLQPTSPLRTEADLQEAYNLYNEKQALAVVSVCEMNHSPLWANTLPDNQSLEGFIKPEVECRGGRQNLPVYYRINGAIYMCRIDYEKMNFSLFHKDSYAYIMEEMNSVDIDTELDFMMAEYLYMQKTEY